METGTKIDIRDWRLVFLAPLSVPIVTFQSLSLCFFLIDTKIQSVSFRLAWW